ncbi:D-sedoheptulose-7-phosphate isomerase [Motilibacter aurantiacus]|uniref:D-sedoheptulose-7-phosphate isomerase n=1 Tax=Motilibacter aurantiacus TaxID=2714955 RepID=UPI00140D5809|nr:SIS domain-containing protein [Motilibacter aurantiacus]NHC45372.1 SIS domain-containing protein [Motilibacter aurantiacus]
MTGCTPTGQAHLHVLAEALDGFTTETATLERWGARLAEVLSAGGRLLALGNGGSAAQAQHLTAELVGRYRDDRAPYSAIALHAETSTLTALLNDYPVEEVFARQVEAHGRPGDVLVAMSTSGRSPNVLAAVRRARAAGLTTWAFTGPRPNPLALEADEAVAVEAPFTATVQELHLVGLHMLCAAFDAALGVIDVDAARIELPEPPLTSAAPA